MLKASLRTGMIGFVLLSVLTAGASEFEPPLPPLPLNLNSEIGISTPTFRQPPYDFDFASGFTVGGYAGADRTKGTFVAFGIVPGVFESGTVIHRGRAGVGVYYRPEAEIARVRLTPIVQYDYDWYARSNGRSALTTASFGIFVRSRNLDGTDPLIEMDRQIVLWTELTSGNTSRSDLGRAVFLDGNQATVFLTMSRSRIYDVWIWTNVACRAGRRFFPFLPSSKSSTHVNAIMPIFAFEEQPVGTIN